MKELLKKAIEFGRGQILENIPIDQIESDTENFLKHTKEKQMNTFIKEAFNEWVLSENYRIAQAYRLALAKEIAGTHRTMGRENLHLYKDLLISSLKQIQPPPYAACPILLDRELQVELYAKITKPNFKNILKEAIDELSHKQY